MSEREEVLNQLAEFELKECGCEEWSKVEDEGTAIDQNYEMIAHDIIGNPGKYAPKPVPEQPKPEQPAHITALQSMYKVRKPI